MVKDMTYALDEARDELTGDQYSAMIGQLLDLAIRAGEMGGREYNREYLDLLVQGEQPLPKRP